MYDFRTLSPIDFELLVRDLLQAELGILVLRPLKEGVGGLLPVVRGYLKGRG